MVTSAVLNGVLALGVIAMVIAPLVWAIATQHHDHPATSATAASLARTRAAIERRAERRSGYRPAVSQA